MRNARARTRRALGVLVVAVGMAAAPSCAAAAVDLAASPGALKDVPMQYRPKFRWWWPTANVDPAELSRELETMKAAGFGGVEQTLLRTPNEWWAPAFRANLRAALVKATSLGMRFDTTLGPMWPISSPAVDDPAKGLSMQEIVFSAIDVAGPSTYTGPVPDVDDNGARAHRLVAVVAAQPANQADPTPPNPATGAVPLVLDPKTATDLTPKVAGGTLTWEVPDGRWKLVGIWSRAKGQRVPGGAGAPRASGAQP